MHFQLSRLKKVPQDPLSARESREKAHETSQVSGPALSRGSRSARPNIAERHAAPPHWYGRQDRRVSKHKAINLVNDQRILTYI